MSRILIHGSTIDSVEAIKRKLDIFMNGAQILTSLDIEKTKDILTEQFLGLLIYEVESFTRKELQLFKDVREWGLSFPVLFICNNVLATDLEMLKNENKPHFLEKNFEDKKLFGVVNKLIKIRQIPQQMLQRYHTNQHVKVEGIQDSFTIESSMYNLSKGGAYCEFDPSDELSLAIGDLVKISVPLTDLSKNHALNAKVVWTTKKGRYSGRHGIGLKFVNNEEIYRSLLGKLA
jgi:Tfp pilus assembly protein PilZ